MSQNLSGRTIALLVADGFNEREFMTIRERLDAEGAATLVVSPTTGPVGRVVGWTGQEGGTEIPVDVPSLSGAAGEFDAAVVPGGGASADRIRAEAASQTFLQHFLDQARPIGFVGEALRVAIAFGMTTGRRVAAPSALRQELDGASIAWSDEPYVSDAHLITCRSSADLPSFLDSFIAEVAASPLRPGQTPPVSHQRFITGGDGDST